MRIDGTGFTIPSIFISTTTKTILILRALKEVIIEVTITVSHSP
jgi:hypothetical protein